MKRAFFYHTRMTGGNPPINLDDALAIMSEQMQRLHASGLAEACDEIHVCSNGGEENLCYAAVTLPRWTRRNVIFHDNGPDAESHLPTVRYLRNWLPAHADWQVAYDHIKGVTHPQDATYRNWRHCMDRVVIDHWRQCVEDLERGYDSVGAHWLTREKYGSQVVMPFWGGMVFWANARFLLTLPEIPDKPSKREDWFLSEGWIGSGPRKPKVKDYAPHWPSLAACR